MTRETGREGKGKGWVEGEGEEMRAGVRMVVGPEMMKVLRW